MLDRALMTAHTKPSRRVTTKQTTYTIPAILSPPRAASMMAPTAEWIPPNRRSRNIVDGPTTAGGHAPVPLWVIGAITARPRYFGSCLISGHQLARLEGQLRV